MVIVHCRFHVKIPHTVQAFALDISVKMGRAKVREEFLKNAHVKDIRVIDMLVIKVNTSVARCGVELPCAYYLLSQQFYNSWQVPFHWPLHL